DRAAFHARRKLIGRPGEQLDEVRGVQSVPHGEVWLGTRLRVLVPRARELAIVATVDAVSDQGTKLLGNAARELDREIRNAAPRVELVGGDDGAGRTGVEAGATSSAMLAHRVGRRERKIGVDLPQEEERAGFAREQQRMLAAPAQSRLGRERD